MLYIFQGFALDTDRRELQRGADVVPVAPQVFDLLEYLIRNRERVVSKDDLLGSIWKGRLVSELALTTRLNAARCAIGDSGEEQQLIRTLPRKGVRFVGVVREERHNEPAPQLAPGQPASALPLPDKPSIAVLPFTNMSTDPDQDYFADGMVEEIITALSRCSWLFVIARNSSFTYKGKAVDVRQVGRELGVRYILEGSVRRSGDRLRFTGQLIDATSGAHIWAERFEGELGDVFDLQDRFTESVVATIEPTLQLAEIARLKHKPTSNLHAYDLLLRAQQCEYEFRVESHAAALRYLEQALAIDQSYAQAMALAAHCYAERRAQGWMTDAEGEAREGLRLARRAVELGKDDANVFWMAGYAVLRFQMDQPRAREWIRRSLELNPNSAIASAIMGEIEANLGNSKDAVQLLNRATRLSPRDPRGWFIASKLAWACLVDYQFDAAVAAARKVLDQNPQSGYALRFLAASLAKQGKLQDARDAITEVLVIEPNLTLAKLRARLTFVADPVWQSYAAALSIAGLPE